MTPGQVAQLGGQARAKALTPERRKEIARKAAAARWPESPAAIEDLCDEIHGVRSVKTFTVSGESLQSVRISLNGQWVELNKTEGTSYPASLTPNEARYLASKLRRLATIADQRRAAK